MKLTEEKLKQMILESMYSPSTLIADAMADPDVHPKIKDLLSSEREEDKRSGLQLLDTLHGDKYSQGAVDHIKLGSPKYARDFKDASNHQINRLKNTLNEFYSVTKLPVKLLQTHYDPRYGGTFTVYSRGTSRDDLKQIQGFKEYLAMQGHYSDQIRNVRYSYSFEVNL